MKIATWNVNSLRVRLPHVCEWLATTPVDILCLQETKLTDDKFPVAELSAIGYDVIFAGQKTYNGVAILYRKGMRCMDVVVNIPGMADEQKRVLSATIDGVRVICAYVPNGQALTSEKYLYKLAWLEALVTWVGGEIASHPRLALLGDYNIAPADADVHDPAAWVGEVLVSEPERKMFERMVGLGLVDSFRAFPQAEKSYSWWDYRMMGFRRNRGLRIDHILVSPQLMRSCSGCRIDVEPRRREQPSDHTPVIATFSEPLA